MSLQALKVGAVSLQLVSMETLHLIFVVPFVIPMQVGFMQIFRGWCEIRAEPLNKQQGQNATLKYRPAKI